MFMGKAQTKQKLLLPDVLHNFPVVSNDLENSVKIVESFRKILIETNESRLQQRCFVHLLCTFARFLEQCA